MKPGYKQTEVGVIPEDWEVVRFDVVLQRVASRRFQIQASQYDSIGRYPVIDQGQSAQVGYSDATEKVHHVRNGGTIVFGDHTCIVKLATRDFVVGADGTQLLVARTGQDVAFHAYALQHRGVASTGYNRHFQFLKERFFQVPPQFEQRAIAEALSDADALIESLEALIAKKRQIKQGAMQELLTGKRRLPGFSGEWETRFAWELGEFRSGSGFPLEHQGSAVGEVAFFKVSDMNTIENGTGLVVANHYVSDATRRLLHAFAFPPGTIMFAKVGAAVFLERKMVSRVVSCVDNNMAGFIPNSSNTEPLYMYHAFQRVSFGALVSTTALPSLNSTTLRSIRFRVPVSREEQRAIAAVLSDLDAELEALEGKLHKARAIKQGMMQELLTGRTRLVSAEVS